MCKPTCAVLLHEYDGGVYWLGIEHCMNDDTGDDMLDASVPETDTEEGDGEEEGEGEGEGVM